MSECIHQYVRWVRQTCDIISWHRGRSNNICQLILLLTHLLQGYLYFSEEEVSQSYGKSTLQLLAKCSPVNIFVQLVRCFSTLGMYLPTPLSTFQVLWMHHSTVKAGTFNALHPHNISFNPCTCECIIKLHEMCQLPIEGLLVRFVFPVYL